MAIMVTAITVKVCGNPRLLLSFKQVNFQPSVLAVFDQFPSKPLPQPFLFLPYKLHKYSSTCRQYPDLKILWWLSSERHDQNVFFQALSKYFTFNHSFAKWGDSAPTLCNQFIFSSSFTVIDVPYYSCINGGIICWGFFFHILSLKRASL